jgi:hypothetical protein
MMAGKLRAGGLFLVRAVRKFNQREELTMRYIQPHITGTFRAVSAIQSEKGAPNQEIGGVLFTNGPAYQADE